MAKMLWHNTMTIDGFVAGAADDMSWMTPYFGADEIVDEVLPQIGALLVGARTFRGIMNSEEAKPYGGAIEVPQFVLTHADVSSAPAGFSFVGGEMADIVEEVKAAAGDRYVAILGQQAGRAVLDADLLDEILVHLTPLILGDGLRMFERAESTKRLTLVRSHQSERVTDLWYRVLSPDQGGSGDR
ncbi:MAG TPA: dihydrofolate reductase family protein [Acidimicrobiales bacterium]|nr:dihydrofolate reductase family protein [Acidimicrobiales bacterium]